ncbi:hypothetical protein GCM10009745_76590 [Kribbella yunnanensis]|uniref:Acyl-CoA dehydrogenase/oxidase C-terminal domain-containing protein n=1 Tax=Kribbella yunnanensis TaxID=190194 RepID=A0ABP4V5A9_9ACTN
MSSTPRQDEPSRPKVYTIFEGTSEIQRLVIARAICTHPSAVLLSRPAIAAISALPRATNNPRLGVVPPAEGATSCRPEPERSRARRMTRG